MRHFTEKFKTEKEQTDPQDVGREHPPDVGREHPPAALGWCPGQEVWLSYMFAESRFSGNSSLIFFSLDLESGLQ